MTVSDLLRDALLEVAVIDPIDPTPPDMQTLALTRFNGILDQWNAQQIAVYAILFPTYTTTGGLSPHTIGVAANTPTWTVTGNRPVDILGANQQIGSGTSTVNIGPITKRARAWWLSQSVQAIQSGVPTDFYYEPTWPNGSLYLWPVPDAAYVVQLELRVVLLEVAEADVTGTFSMPPGYLRALMLTLAEDLLVPLSVPLTPMQEGKLTAKATAARAVIFGNNNPPLRIATRDYGMPGGNAAGGFNWMTGTGGGR